MDTGTPTSEQPRVSSINRAGTRRALLGIAAASVAAAAAGKVMSPGRAEAASVDMFTEGNYTPTATTGLEMGTSDGPAFYGGSVTASGSDRKGILGYAGIAGNSVIDGVGVHGYSSIGARVGVVGEANDANGTGVQARNSVGGGKALDVIGRGVVAATSASDSVAFHVSHSQSSLQAIVGQSGSGTLADDPAGVLGFSSDIEGIGVIGQSDGADGAGVAGVTTSATGTGVFANNIAGGLALRVAGKSSADADLNGVAFAIANASTSGNATGLRGSAGTGTPSVLGAGVHGYNGGLFGGIGVYGEATGSQGIGVSGDATDASGVGVYASSSGGGTALSVEGPSLLNGTSTFTGAATFSSSVTASSFVGAGGGLTGLSAAKIATGTLNDARLSSNIAKLSAATNSFTGQVNARKLAGPAGKALVLVGSGSGTVRKGKDTVKITNPLCKSRSKILVTLQTTTGTVALLGVKPANGSFDVKLTATVSAATKVAYLILA